MRSTPATIAVVYTTETMIVEAVVDGFLTTKAEFYVEPEELECGIVMETKK
jgi:hypothetical protein